MPAADSRIRASFLSCAAGALPRLLRRAAPAALSLFLAAAATPLSAAVGEANAAGLSDITGAPGSFVGMGAKTGTPSGDVREAIRPTLQTVNVPAPVAAAKVDFEDLPSVPMAAAGLERSVTIGIQASLGYTVHAAWLRYTVDSIQHVLGSHARVLWLDDDSISLGLRSRQLDFFISDADAFILDQRTESAEAIASFVPVQTTQAEEAQACVIFTKRESEEEAAAESVRSGGLTAGRGGAEPFSIESLKGASIAALDPHPQTWWLAALAEFQMKGIPAAELQDAATFYERGPEAVVNAVMSGAKDAGILPACTLEAFQREGKLDIRRDLTIVNEQYRDRLACVHSSAAYPSWTLAAAPSVDPAAKKALSTLFYSMNLAKYGGEWALPALNRSIYDLFYELKMGPYADLAGWSFQRFVRENADILALGMLGLFIAASYMVSLSVLVRRKTRQLSKALEERDLIEAEAAQSRQHIANLERTGIVGQMSTIIAHELKQPLSAIMNYANGLHRRTTAGKFDQESFDWALTEIVDQAERASEIVNRVRAYAKHDYPPRTVADLSVVIGNAISTFRRSRQTNAQIDVRVNRGSMAEVDAWEIELAVLNLLKNAADAISGVPNPLIEVSLEPVDLKTWALSVADNGPYVSDEQLALFFKPLHTSKGSKGMGLGLSIVANIAERHAGRVTVERNGSRGVRFIITLPRIPKEGEAMTDAMLPPKLTVLPGSEGSRPTAGNHSR